MDENVIIDDAISEKQRLRQEKRVRRAARNATGLGVFAIIFGAIAIVITVIRLILLPIAIAAGAFSIVAFEEIISFSNAFWLAWAWLGGMWFLPLIRFFIYLLVIAAVMAVELFGVELGGLALAFAIGSRRTRRRAPEPARSKRVLNVFSMILAITGLSVAAVAEVVLIIPIIIAMWPIFTATVQTVWVFFETIFSDFEPMLTGMLVMIGI